MNDNTQRDEWARIIVGELHPGPQDDPMTWPAQVWRLADAIVERIKPRTITTVEELDALALGTVLLGANRLSHQKELPDYWGVAGELILHTKVALPAVILHEQEAEVGA